MVEQGEGEGDGRRWSRRNSEVFQALAEHSKDLDFILSHMRSF